MEHGSLHSRIREFEYRIRKWRQLRFGLIDAAHLIPPRRSASSDPKKSHAVAPSADSSPAHRAAPIPVPTGCKTSPMPRKNMNFPSKGLDFTDSSSRAKKDAEEIEFRYEKVKQNSGVLKTSRYTKGEMERRRFLGLSIEGNPDRCVQNGDFDTIRASIEDLEFIGDIGHGSCGHVTKNRLKGRDTIMAVKHMARTNDKEENKRIIMDLEVLTRCFDCNHIVFCYGYFINNTQVRICMELMATCLDRLLKRTKQKPIPENIIGHMNVSIVKALDYLKDRHSIIHRDIKPSNILLDWNGDIKLCDFGISGHLIESRAHTVAAGCPPYMGPERFDPKHNTDYDVRSDVWALGITLVELATGRYPYKGSEFEILSSIIQMPPPVLKIQNGFSIEIVNFVSQCLQKDYEKRPKYKFLLAHRFVKQYESTTSDVATWFAQIMADFPDEDISEDNKLLLGSAR